MHTYKYVKTCCCFRYQRAGVQVFFLFLAVGHELRARACARARTHTHTHTRIQEHPVAAGTHSGGGVFVGHILNTRARARARTHTRTHTRASSAYWWWLHSAFLLLLFPTQEHPALLTRILAASSTKSFSQYHWRMAYIPFGAFVFCISISHF